MSPLLPSLACVLLVVSALTGSAVASAPDLSSLRPKTINQERADYIFACIPTILGKHKARRYSQNTRKAAVDGFTSARGLPVDEKELTSLARTCSQLRKGALYSKLTQQQVDESNAFAN
jgi:hypothetical protein